MKMPVRSIILRPALGAFSALLLAGCSTAAFDGFSGEPTPAPASYAEAPTAAAPAPVNPAWWEALNDPALDALIALALADNRDLIAAEAELERARALAAVQGWTLLPFGDVIAAASRGRTASSLDGQSTPYPESELYAIGLQASWEADLFGRLRNGARAARRDADAIEAARRGVATSVAAETAATYVALRGAEARLDAARANAESQYETLRLTEDMRGAGRGSGLDIARAREQLATTEALIPLLEADRATAGYALDILIGAGPGASAEIVDAARAIPAPPEAPGLGAPAELLQRRPDIVEARMRLDAAIARVNAAKVDWWPRITLVGGAGFDAFSLSDIGNDETLSWSLGPRIDWPALDFRRNALRAEAAGYGAEAEFARYDRAIAAGLAEVETALANFAATRRAGVLADEAAAAALNAAEIARLRYREGLDPFIQALDSERRLAEAEDRRARAAAAAAIAYVRLGQALGAGWEAVPAETDIAQTAE